MPTARFSVTVTSQEFTSNEALADVGRYLAYADQTDLFGYHGSIDNTSAELHDGIWHIDITFSAPVAREEDIQLFLRECETLARVEDAECLTNPNI